MANFVKWCTKSGGAICFPPLNGRKSEMNPSLTHTRASIIVWLRWHRPQNKMSLFLHFLATHWILHILADSVHRHNTLYAIILCDEMYIRRPILEVWLRQRHGIRKSAHTQHSALFACHFTFHFIYHKTAKRHDCHRCFSLSSVCCCCCCCFYVTRYVFVLLHMNLVCH